MENICNSLTESTRNAALCGPDEVGEIMTSIYSFLSENILCPDREISDRCNENCKDIGSRFKHQRCIFIEKSLIKGDELSFKVPGINPFLYTIPREYGKYEHLLMRLGATEKVTSLQLANLLKAIKNRCENTKIDCDLVEKAKIATVLLLKYAYRESRRGKEASKITDLTEIFLPSDAEFLIKSNEFISQVPLRLAPVVSKRNWNVLFPLETCGLPRACTKKYLAALPEHLRPVPWDHIVCETLDPSCKNAVCKHCLGDSFCSFIEKYVNILRSRDFQEGVARVLFHQKESGKLSEEEVERSSRFLDPNKVEIKCMESITIYLVDTVTRKRVEEDYSRKSLGYVDTQDDRWTLYIVHETIPLGFLTRLVNEVMDSCIEDKYTSLLIDMMQLDPPSQIAEWLTDQDITLLSPKGHLQIDEIWSDESEDDSGDESGPSHRSKTREAAYLPSAETYYEYPADRKEAYRWMKQSLSDLQAAMFMLTADPPFNALACFHSHEAVEKSLKAVLYAECGIDSEQLRSHRVDLLAYDVVRQMKSTTKLSNLAESVKNYYVPPRYPNAHTKYIVPLEAYDEEQAKEAIENTTELVEIVKTLIDW